jgi:hypothetical protein
MVSQLVGYSIHGKPILIPRPDIDRKVRESFAPQHDDHIWLTVGGEAWAIKWIHWPFIGLWRGYAPDLEFNYVDMSKFNTDSYVARAAARLASEGGR